MAKEKTQTETETTLTQGEIDTIANIIQFSVIGTALCPLATPESAYLMTLVAKLRALKGT